MILSVKGGWKGRKEGCWGYYGDYSERVDGR